MVHSSFRKSCEGVRTASDKRPWWTVVLGQEKQEISRQIEEEHPKADYWEGKTVSSLQSKVDI